MSNKFPRFIIAIFLSCFTGVYSIDEINIIRVVLGVMGVILTFIISYYLLGKYDLLKEIKSYKDFPKIKKNLIIIVTLLSTFTFVKNALFILIRTYEKVFELFMYKNLLLPFYIIVIIITIVVGLVNFFILWNLVINRFGTKLWGFLKSFSNFEKKILYFYIFTFASLNLIILIFTSAFVLPMHEGDFTYDAILSLDTAYLTYGYNGADVFSSPSAAENDIRHILFGIISLPLSMICMPISYIIGFLIACFDFDFLSWNIISNTIYGYLISVGQAFLFALSGILIYKMLRNEIEEKLSKSFLILYLISYPTVLFTVAVEQYAIVTFTLVLFVYFVIKSLDSKNTFLLAGLSLSPSFAMLPFVFSGKKVNLNLLLRNISYIVTVLAIACIYFGQLPELVQTISRLKFLSQFAAVDTLSYVDKFIQYIGFIPSIFMAPSVIYEDGWILTDDQGIFYNIFGLLLLVFLIYSIIANRHKKIMFISTYWVLISFVILVIVGWGSVERTMVLYTSYFGWAFFILFALGFSKIFGNKSFGNPLLVVIISILSIYNATEFINYVINVGTFR